MRSPIMSTKPWGRARRRRRRAFLDTSKASSYTHLDVYKRVGQGPPPPSPRVLGHQQGQPARHVLGHQQGQPAAVPRVLGLQQGQPAPPPPLRVQYAPTPDILRHHYGHAVMPPGVPAHHHGHGGPHPGFLGYQCGQAAPRQIQGVAVQPQRRYVLDPYHHFQEPSPGVAGYYSHQDTVVYYYPTPSFVRLDPQQGEEMAHMEKKPRLAYGGSPPGSEMSSCVVQASTSQGQCGDTDADAKVFQEPEPVPAPSPPQEIPGTGTAQPELDDDDAGKAAVELMPESDFMDLPDLFDLDDVPDYVMPQGMFKPPSDEEPLPQPDFDEFVKPPSDEEPPPQPDFDEFVKPPSDEEPPPQPDFNEFVKPPSDDEPPPQPDFDLFSWEDFMKDAPDFLTAARSPGQT
ncbi:hypothetical protein BAE44_0011050 [Dichanthelium oligosanthes]|uniref:Uncharacterized protein n=1 Tax=Dichanthelium oligosanthes TaxID=888268 RepID=A0A1E5VS80_9POAL|nr:hypothetical protein BAE44_0011050 [Dichanthelium oligosanthes]